MKLKVGVVGAGGDVRDLAVVVEPGVSIGDLAGALARRDPRSEHAGAAGTAGTGGGDGAPVTLAPWSGDRPGAAIPPELSLLEAGLRSGGVVKVVSAHEFAHGAGRGPGVATLRVCGGPDAGKQFELPAGTSYVGRDPSCDVTLTDPLVSKRHAKVHVTSVVELVDTNSANGIVVDGGLVPRVVLSPESVALLGDTEIAVTLHHPVTESTGHGGAHPQAGRRSSGLNRRLSSGGSAGSHGSPTTPQWSRMPRASVKCSCSKLCPRATARTVRRPRTHRAADSSKPRSWSGSLPARSARRASERRRRETVGLGAPVEVSTWSRMNVDLTCYTSFSVRGESTRSLNHAPQLLGRDHLLRRICDAPRTLRIGDHADRRTRPAADETSVCVLSATAMYRRGGIGIKEFYSSRFKSRT